MGTKSEFKQAVILQVYLVRLSTNDGLWPPVPPTIRELAELLGTSTSVVNYHLIKLVNAGLLAKRGYNKTFVLTEKGAKKLFGMLPWPLEEQDGTIHGGDTATPRLPGID